MTRIHHFLLLCLAYCLLLPAVESVVRGGRLLQERDVEWWDADEEWWINNPEAANGKYGRGNNIYNSDDNNQQQLRQKRSRSRTGMEQHRLRRPEDEDEQDEETDSDASNPTNVFSEPGRTATPNRQQQCPTNNGFSSSQFPYRGQDSAERLLQREGILNSIPTTRCGLPNRKNVILAIGDGMGWEMVRAGAIAKQVVKELEGMGCNITTGCPNNQAAKEAFLGRNLSSYYTQGKGSGLSFQELPGFDLVTTTVTILQKSKAGNHGAPSFSLLKGEIPTHDDGMAPLATDKCGLPLDVAFQPTDHSTQQGNMILWDNVRGGEYPWDPRYYQDNPDTSDGFDPTYIMQHATDSAATATTLATGHKVATSMVAVNLYEEEISTIVEDAMKCDMAAGVVTSVPVLHATPAAFVTHSNDRQKKQQLQKSFRRTSPTLASGTCARQFYPDDKMLDSIRNGTLQSQWTFFEQKWSINKEDFYNGIEKLDPDNGDHVLVCLGGDFSRSKQDYLPYRGVDSSYSKRWCGKGVVEVDNTTGSATFGKPIEVKPNPVLCDHYGPDELKQIPHISTNVKQALDFLGKDDDGFFLMYEQGDIDKAAHANHMDDMLGTLLDFDDSVRVIMDWIATHGGWEKNTLYVTADHDHYLTLLPHFPETLAMLLIAGESHNITPGSNSDINPWDVALRAGRHWQKYSDKTQTEHIRDFTTWSKEDIDNVAHFWGAAGSGGNGWGSHSTRPVPLFYAGDNGCIEKFRGKGYQVLGRQVEGVPGKVDQAHIHACMMKNLFGF